MPAVGSDHWLICLEWERLVVFLKRPFRFEKFWLTHPDFHRLIKEWWDDLSKPEGSRMYVLQQKLKYVKEHLRKWNKESFGHILMEKIHLENQIGELQMRQMSGDYTEHEKTMEQGLLKEQVQREKKEEILWRKKSWQLWLKEGDRNTGFFHKSTI